MSNASPDVIDELVAIAPGSRLDAVRRKRNDARDNAQKSYLALFEPAFPGNVTAEERFAVAAFVAGLHDQPETAAHYRTEFAARTTRPGLLEAVDAEIRNGATSGPYGHYPAGPLSREDKAGPIFRTASEHSEILSPRLAAALEHVHFLVFRPRDASPKALQALLDAGWSTTDIVTLSQLVAFLSFQIRVVAGLRALSAEISAEASPRLAAAAN